MLNAISKEVKFIKSQIFVKNYESKVEFHFERLKPFKEKELNSEYSDTLFSYYFIFGYRKENDMCKKYFPKIVNGYTNS